MGDAAGIGPEICLKALNCPRVRRWCLPVILGDGSILKKVASRCRLPLPPVVLSPENFLKGKIASPAIVDFQLLKAREIKPGLPQAVCGEASFRYLETAVSLARKGKVAALVTAPICKESLHLAGRNYPGHTEMLREFTGAQKICMMLTSKSITCSLVTTHTSLASVPGLLSAGRILEVMELTASALARLKGRKPRLSVCALNPHAGEQGLFGTEEKVFILPAIRAARKKGMLVNGPWPADTAFLPERRRQTDGYICLYHDQGLIPFKMLSFETGVNVTLGLPIVRTSVDHGTAFDLAWKGLASERSLVEAIRYAVLLARNRTNPD